MTKRKSEKRQKTKSRGVRYTPAEDAIVMAKAPAFGGFSAMVRHLTLGASLPAGRADREAIALLSGELGRLRTDMGKPWSNLNQIAHHLNAGRPGDTISGALNAALLEHEQVIRTLEELRLACMQALGFERNRKDE